MEFGQPGNQDNKEKGKNEGEVATRKLTEDEIGAFRAELPKIKKKLKQEITKKTQELGKILRKYEPFDIIVNLKLKNSLFDPENFKEYESKGNNAYVEYIGCFYLTIPPEELAARQKEPVPGADLEAIDSLTSEIFRTQSLIYRLPDEASTEDDTLSQIRRETLSRSLIVRYMYYPHHLEQTLRDLFSPINEELKNLLGFDVEDALQIIYAIVDLEGTRLAQKRELAIHEGKEIRRAVKIYRKKGRNHSQLPDAIIKQLAELKPSDSHQRINDITLSWTFYEIGELFSFTPEEISEACKVNQKNVNSYLSAMSLKFGALDESFRLPSPTPPLLTKTLIYRDGKYFNPVAQQQIAGLQLAIENMLNPASPDAISSDLQAWSKYEQIRAKFLEDKAFELLKTTLKPKICYQNLSYSLGKMDKTNPGELDGLLLLDDLAIIIEAKAGSFSLPARRGAPERMKRQLKALVGNAFLQGNRAKSYLENNNICRFKLNNGAEIEINTTGIRKYFVINVTLETLDAFVTNMHILDELKIIDASPSNSHWSVALNDLLVLSELVEFPSQLIHYLERRLRLTNMVSTHDELDWFGNYLSEGLYFDHLLDENPNTHIQLLTHTTDFDDYYLYKTGVRKTPVQRPRQVIPNILKKIISELERFKPLGYVYAICRILDIDGSSREALAENIELTRKTALRDRQIHDFTMLFNSASLGITYMSGPVEKGTVLPQRLSAYTSLKKYQQRYDNWVGLASIADAPAVANIGIVLQNKWEANEEEAQRLQTFQAEIKKHTGG